MTKLDTQTKPCAAHGNTGYCKKCAEGTVTVRQVVTPPKVTPKPETKVAAPAKVPAVTGPLTEETALALTEEVKRDMGSLWKRVARLHDENAHVLLGYPSWDDYTEHALGISRSRAFQLLAAARVVQTIESTTGGLPELTTLTERTARIAAPLVGKPKELVAAIEKATEGGVVRASKLTTEVAKRTGKPEPEKQICMAESKLRAIANGDADAILELRKRFE